jgi:hypothetical protein
MPTYITFHPSKDIMCVDGKTFHVKEQLKKAGAQWNNGWTIKSEIATKEFLAELNALASAAIKAEKDVEKKKREDAAALASFYKTPEGKEQRWKEIQELKNSPAGAAYNFICCKECEVINWERKHSSCTACGINGNNFFVRGSIYTGD